MAEDKVTGDDFDGETMTGVNVTGVFDLGEAAFPKCFSDLVFPNTCARCRSRLLQPAHFPFSLINKQINLLVAQKEFVKDDEDMEEQQPSDGGRIAESEYAAISFCGNEPQGSLGAPETSRRSPTHKETASCLNPAGGLTSDKTLVNPSRTGDPTQDMLDLFLGPLLKKPLEEEKKAEVITDDMVFAHALRKQNQEIVLGDVPVPLTKKKSSLKDKVAMFLD